LGVGAILALSFGVGILIGKAIVWAVFRRKRLIEFTDAVDRKALQWSSQILGIGLTTFSGLLILGMTEAAFYLAGICFLPSAAIIFIMWVLVDGKRVFIQDLNEILGIDLNVSSDELLRTVDRYNDYQKGLMIVLFRDHIIDGKDKMIDAKNEFFKPADGENPF